MGMDPNTGEFQALKDAVEKQAAEAKGWVVFHIHELISIKGQQFRVVDIGRTHVILGSVASERDSGTIQSGADHVGASKKRIG